MTSLLVALFAAQVQTVATPENLTLKVGEDSRRALVFRGTEKTSAPLVFVFHGFTGSGVHAAAAYRIHREWPEATIIYPQGLEVNLLNRKGPGWQIAVGMQGDRDLKFYDAMLEKARKDYGIDPKRVYTTGMSNGAIFSYVLLTARSSTLAAAAPVAGLAPMAFRSAPAAPIMIIHGTGDELLRFPQAERSRDLAIANNKASKATKEWAKGYTLYPGEGGKDVIFHQHDGGHDWPKDASAHIVKFFKEHSR